MVSLSIHFTKRAESFKGCFAQLRDFKRVRRYLTTSTSILVANALLSSRLHYCNSFYRSLSKFNLHKLQCLQNSAAPVVTNASKFSSIFVHTFNPSIELLQYETYKWWRCKEVYLLVVPKFSHSSHKSVKQTGYSFAFYAPTVWNRLPVDVRSFPPLEFLEEKSSFLFSKSYPPWLLILNVFPWCLLVPILSHPWTFLFWSLSLVVAPQSLLYAEIECYKSPIRISWHRFYLFQ